MAKWQRFAIIGLVLAVGIVGIHTWLGERPGHQGLGENEQSSETVEPGLTLKDVTLEQPDDNGNLLWRVRGDQVSYSPDQQVASITKPDGDLYQDGEIIYYVKADTGEIRENGKVILLNGNIVATGAKNQAVLKGNQLEWRPEEDVLIVRDQITGTHPQIRASAREARVFNRQKYMQLSGTVVAHTVVKDPKTEPWLKLQTENMYWFWELERVDADTPLKIEQFRDQSIINAVSGNSGQVNLAAQTATLTGNVVMQLLEFPLTVYGEDALWKVADQHVWMQKPLKVVHPQEKVTITALRGEMDLNSKLVFLDGQINALADRNQAHMTSDNLLWNVEAETMLAQGNVRYRQVNPSIVLTGPTATGQLKDQTIVVSGGQVVTEIVPN